MARSQAQTRLGRYQQTSGPGGENVAMETEYSDSSDSDSDPDFVLEDDCEQSESDAELPGSDPKLFDPEPSTSDCDSESGLSRVALHDNEDGSMEDLVEIDEHVRRLESVAPAYNLDEYDLDALHDGNIYPPEYFRKGIETFNKDEFRRKEYSKGTLDLMKRVQNQWQSFCLKILKKDWRRSLLLINIQTIYHFLNWHLSQRTGKGGRLKRPMKSKTSLITFWCCFRLVFQREANSKIDARIDRDLLHNGLVALAKKHKLTHRVRENRSMTLQDLKLQIQTTLSTTEKAFKLGELRILAVLFLLLLAPQGSRPESILEMRFGDIQVLLIRDPTDPQGPPRLVLELSVLYTKRYLGPKSEKTFIIPEVLFDPSLFLSPHIFLLAILFRHRAFMSEDLNDHPSVLGQLRIHPSTNELPLPLKEEIRGQYIFRQSKGTSTGYVMSEERISKGMMGAWVKRIGQILGFERNTICYTLRYRAGNNLDQNVKVSEDLRNLIMDHGSSATFPRHYLARAVCADVNAISRGEQPQQELVTQATSHGSSRDPRRPINLTPDQLNSLKFNRQYVRLGEILSTLPKASKKRAEVAKRRKALLSRLRRVELEKVRTAWNHQQSIDDTERQIQGREFAPFSTRNAPPTSPAQHQMLSALSVPLENNLEAQFHRRSEAIKAIVAYCDVEEPLSTKVLEARRPPPPPTEVDGGPDPMERARELRKSVLGEVNHVKRCFMCVAKALTLSPGDPNVVTLLRVFYDHKSLSRHFISTHLKPLEREEGRGRGNCPICTPAVFLIDQMHFQNHVESVHGIRTSRKKRPDL